jgi:hypothetical protein
VDEFLLLGLALLVAGAVAIGGIIFYEAGWKARRRRRIERDHARSKLGERAR